MFIDIHCHLDSEFYDDIDNIIENSLNNNVKKVIYNGCDPRTNNEVLKLIKKYDFVYGAIGFHPTELSNVKEEDYLFLEENIKNKKIVAIGEIGLDYHYENTDKELQKYHFIKQLELAKKYDMPVIIHSRDCINETYNILKDYNLKGIMHCYSGSVEMARMFNKIGFLLGIGGIVTFKNAVKVVEVIKEIDLEYIVVETDSPYLSPEPFRGKINEPINVGIIMEKICDIKGLRYKEVEDVISSNVLGLFDNMLDL